VVFVAVGYVGRCGSISAMYLLLGWLLHIESTSSEIRVSLSGKTTQNYKLGGGMTMTWPVCPNAPAARLAGFDP